MAYLYCSVDLGDISTWELMDELESRDLDDHEQQQLSALIYEQDKRKWELFLKIKNRFTLQELEELFKENLTVMPIPREQLTLAI